MAVIGIKTFRIISNKLWVFLVVLLSASCSASNNEESHPLSCDGYKINIPGKYVIENSSFFWVDAASGLDDSKCSVRINFEELENLKAVLTIVDPSNKGRVSLIEEQASNSTGIFKEAVADEKSFPGFTVIYQTGRRDNAYLFKRVDRKNLEYLGVCSQMAGDDRHCVNVYRTGFVQLEFSLNGPQVEYLKYKKIVETLDSLINTWGK